MYDVRRNEAATVPASNDATFSGMVKSELKYNEANVTAKA